MKKIRLFLAGILLVIMADAQTDDYNSQLIKVLPLSPSAAALGKFGDQPVGCYTGVPRVNVPIYTIEAGDIKVPLTLDYHNDGVKVEDIASWVGTGWSCSFGGSINRQLRGMPDENGGYLTDNTAINQFGTWNNEQQEAYIARTAERLTDPQNDLFTYSFGNQSGKFFFNPNGEVIPKPQNKIHFEYGNYFGKSGFKVVNTDGLVYYFLDKEETNSQTTSLPASGDPLDATSSWYISKIVSAQGNESVDFEYESESVSYNSIVSRTVYLNDPPTPDNADCGETQPGMSITYTNTLELKLKRIQFPNGEIIINRMATERADLPGDHALQSIQINNSQGREIKRFDFSYTTGSYNRLFLNAIQMSANAVSLGAYSFEYDRPYLLPDRTSTSQDYWGYFNDANNTTLVPYCFIFGSTNNIFPYVGADRTPNPLVSTAGSLTKMHYPTGGYTEFTMENNTISNLASVIAPGYDLKGGSGRFQLFGDATGTQTTYNGSFSITEDYGGSGGVIAKIEIGLPGSADMPPPPAGSEDPVIQLTKPDGSVINFRNNSTTFLTKGTYTVNVDFSSNPDYDLIHNFYFILTYDYGVRDNPDALKNLVVGGLRIKSIKDVDPISGNIYERDYSYVKDDGVTSTGILGNFPSYQGHMLTCRSFIDVEGIIHTTICSKLSLGSISQSPLLITQGSFVGYGMVDELIDQGNSGKNRYFYTTAADFDDVGPYKIYPYPIPDSRDEFRGILLKQQALKKNVNGYAAVTEKSYLYNFKNETGYQDNDPHLVVTPGWFFRQFYFPGPCYYSSADQLHLSKEVQTTSGFIKLLSETSRTYDQDNPNKYAEVVTSYDYSDNNLQVNKVTSKKSNDDLSVVTYKFPLDYSFTAAATDDKVKGIAALVGQNKINERVETSSYTSQNGGALQLMGSKCTVFDPAVGNPGSVFTLDIKGPVNDFTPSSIQSDNLVMDNRYTPKINFNKYLSNGRLVQEQKANDVLKSYLWDYNGTYAIAEITNADVGQTAYTSFETDDLGRWSLNAGSTFLANNGNVTGQRSLNGGVNTTVPQGTYILSLWSAATPVVNGQPVSTPPRKSPGTGKSFYQVELTGISSVNVTGDNIDEIRLYPKGAEMTTVTYEPLVGITSQSDARGYINYYEYDDAGRLSVIRDEAGNVVKSINYHYLNQ